MKQHQHSSIGIYIPEYSYIIGFPFTRPGNNKKSKVVIADQSMLQASMKKMG